MAQDLPATERVAFEFEDAPTNKKFIRKFREQFPGRYFGLASSRTLVVYRSDALWVKQEVMSSKTSCTIYPVMPISELPSDEAADLRGRRRDPLSTLEVREKLRSLQQKRLAELQNARPK